jgi:hypothetical protein
MPHPLLRRLGPALFALALVAAAPWPAAAQQAPAAPPRADPLDARAAVPPLVWRSSLAQHRRWQEQPVGDWPQANQTVNRIGGWRSYAREAHAPTPAPAPAASTPAGARP